MVRRTNYVEILTRVSLSGSICRVRPCWFGGTPLTCLLPALASRVRGSVFGCVGRELTWSSAALDAPMLGLAVLVIARAAHVSESPVERVRWESDRFTRLKNLKQNE